MLEGTLVRKRTINLRYLLYHDDLTYATLYVFRDQHGIKKDLQAQLKGMRFIYKHILIGILDIRCKTFGKSRRMDYFLYLRSGRKKKKGK